MGISKKKRCKYSMPNGLQTGDSESLICCEKVGTTTWGKFRCTVCGGLCCSFHVDQWDRQHPRCFFCFGQLTCLSAGAETASTINHLAPSRSRKALLIVDGLYIAGMQRHCLELLGVLNASQYECTVVSIYGGGGKWADRFLSESRCVIINLDATISWPELLRLVDGHFRLVVAQLSHAIRWVLNQGPINVNCFAHLHSEPSEHESITTQELVTMTQRFRKVLFPSATTLEIYRTRLESVGSGAVTANWFVLPNAVPRFASRPQAVIRTASANSDTFRIAVISRLDHDKFSIPLFINTVIYLSQSEIKFTVRVAGDGELAHELETAIAAASLSSHVTMLGFVDEGLADLYEWADAVFLPSKRESMPYVMLESSHFGTPVVMPRVGFLVEPSATPSMTYVFEPGDAAEAANLLLTVSLERSEPKHISKAENPGFLTYKEWASIVQDVYDLRTTTANV